MIFIGIPLSLESLDDMMRRRNVVQVGVSWKSEEEEWEGIEKKR